MNIKDLDWLVLEIDTISEFLIRSMRPKVVYIGIKLLLTWVELKNLDIISLL